MTHNLHTPKNYQYTQADDGFEIACDQCGHSFHMSDNEWAGIAQEVTFNAAPVYCPDCQLLPPPPTETEWAVILLAERNKILMAERSRTDLGQGIIEYAGAILLAMFVCVGIALLIELIFGIDVFKLFVHLAQWIASKL